MICLQEQIQWAVEEGADFIVAETFSDYGEAKIALEAIQRTGKVALFDFTSAWSGWMDLILK